MTAVLAHKDTNINLRAPAMKRDLIDHAAKVAGKSRTDFILDASCEKAEIILADQTRFALSEEQMARFNALLEEPLSSADVVARLLAKPSPWER